MREGSNMLSNVYGDAKIGEGSKVACFVEIGPGVRVGERCRIQAFTFIPEGVEIGDDCLIGPHACFTNVRRPDPTKKNKYEKTIVGNRCVIGANATIVCGIEIGDDVFIGAGAIVTRNVPGGAEVKGWY